MSYRTLKRVLGETSLERKCRFLFALVMCSLIGGSFYWYASQTERQVREQTRITGRLLMNPILVAPHWKWWENNPDFRTVIEALLEDIKPEELRQYKPQFFRPEEVPPAYKKAVSQFQIGQDEVLLQTPGGQDALYLAAVRAKASCVNCHTHAGLKEGDMIRIAAIHFPAAPYDFNRAVLISFAIVTGFLAMLAAYFIVRYVIVKPLKHLRDVSESVSRGNLNLRSDIRTGDEFEELSHAFNRMLRSLVDMQEQLRRVNSDLDSKVDQLAQANMALFEMNRLKSDFLATVSHELRTPLNSILGFSDLLCSTNQLNEKGRRWIQNIESSGRMLLAMINDILNLAKIESGRMEMHLEDFSLHDLVEGVVAMMRPLAEKKNIDLEPNIAPSVPLLHQDAQKIHQILENLLSNAIKFTPEGGRVTVTAQADDSHLCLRVIDTGVGISKEDQAHIFEKFRQGSGARAGEDGMAREYPGTGLGLSIVKELCKLLDGEVSVESELGQGSTFTVQLPLRLEERPPLEIPLSPGVDLTKARRIDLRLGPPATPKIEEVAR